MNHLQVAISTYQALYQAQMGEVVDVKVVLKRGVFSIAVTDKVSGCVVKIPSKIVARVNALVHSKGIETLSREFTLLNLDDLGPMEGRIGILTIKTSKSSLVKLLTEPDPLTTVDPTVFFYDLERASDKLEIKYYDSENNGFENFTNVRCPKRTRVKLANEGDDIHANFVSFGGTRAILTQYPRSHAREFWMMVKEQPTQLIVDLTQLPRNGVPAYYPQEVGNSSKWKGCEVTLLEKETIGDNIERSTYSINGEKRVERIHYKGWVDGAAISGAEVQRILQVIGEDRFPAIHCMAGVGRSGALFTCWALSQLNRTITKEDIAEVILTGRGARGPKFVQTPAQLRMILEFLTLPVVTMK